VGSSERRFGSLTKGLAGLVGVGLVIAHLLALRDPSGVTGLLLILDNLFEVLLAIVILGLGAALGHGVMRYLGIECDSEADMLAFSAALGSGVLATSILFLGMAGQLDSLPLGLVLFAGAWLARRDVARLPNLIRRATEEISAKSGRPVLVLCLFVAIAMLVRAVAPATDYDSLMYHLQGPAQFLQRGAVYLPQGNLQVAFVGLAHMLYIPPLAFGAPETPAVLSVFFALGLGVVLLQMGARIFGSRAGRLSLSLLWGSPIVILVALTPKVDVTLAFFVILGHYALLKGLERPSSADRWVLLSGLLLGLGVGIKYLALIYVMALTPVLVALLYKASPGSIQRVRVGGVFVLAIVGASLPWLLKNWFLFGAPFFPYFSGPFVPEWMAALGSSAHQVAASGASLHPLASVREHFSLVAWFLHPERLTPEAEGWAYRANVAFLFVVAAVAFIRRRHFAAILLPGILYGVGLLLVSGGKLNLRYLVPILPVLTLASAGAVAEILGYVRAKALRVAIVSLLIGISLYPSGLALIVKLRESRAPLLAAGVISRGDFQSGRPGVFTYRDMTTAVNRAVPEDGTVLMLFEGRGYGFVPRVLQDEILTNWPLLSQTLSPHQCLEGTGITHVLVGTGILSYFVRRGLDPRSIHWARFADFETRCLTPLERRRGYELYEVPQH